MKNKNGQSLIDVVFSIGILSLVLVGVMMLVVITTRAKNLSSERKKATQLSQLLIENKVVEIKNDTLAFWNKTNELNGQISENNDGAELKSDFAGYLYDVEYRDCGINSCNIVFTVKWGDSKSLSVERLFYRQGL